MADEERLVLELWQLALALAVLMSGFFPIWLRMHRAFREVTQWRTRVDERLDALEEGQPDRAKWMVWQSGVDARLAADEKAHARILGMLDELVKVTATVDKRLAVQEARRNGMQQQRDSSNGRNQAS